ncbi:MAG TPA: pentapeptide repeat-containing protein [Candidatus Obscuribacterales bacterium]
MTADTDSPLPNDDASDVNPSEPGDGSEGSMLLTDPPHEESPRSAATSEALPPPIPLAEPRVAPLLTSDSLPSRTVLFAIALSVAFLSLLINSAILGVASAGILLILSITVIGPALYDVVANVLSPQQRSLLLATASLILALGMLLRFAAWGQRISRWAATQVNWEAVGALGDAFGALGQILIAVLAVYIAWRQYVISKDLTIQQNTITQQQTIDSYFQGISDLVLDEEGLLEDWPQERAIAEGRTAAILSSVDAGGKAKIVRFLSQSRLLTPLRRDRRLGRAILDGAGGYQEDRAEGVRVIDLGVMLAGANLSGSDLRWTDLSEVNLIRANLSHCDFVKTNFARTILCDANLTGSDLMGARLYYGSAATATPRTRSDRPNYQTGAFTGAVIENANFSQVARLSDEQRYYCCAWGGSKTRATVPGGCNGIPNLLGR